MNMWSQLEFWSLKSKFEALIKIFVAFIKIYDKLHMNKQVAFMHLKTNYLFNKLRYWDWNK